MIAVWRQARARLAAIAAQIRASNIRIAENLAAIRAMREAAAATTPTDEASRRAATLAEFTPAELDAIARHLGLR